MTSSLRHRLNATSTSKIAPTGEFSAQDFGKVIGDLDKVKENVSRGTPIGQFIKLLVCFLAWLGSFAAYMALYGPSTSKHLTQLSWTIENQTTTAAGVLSTVGLMNSAYGVQLNWAFTGLFVANIILYLVQMLWLACTPNPQLGKSGDFDAHSGPLAEGEADQARYHGSLDSFFQFFALANYPLIAVILLNLMGVQSVFAALGISVTLVAWIGMLFTFAHMSEFLHKMATMIGGGDGTAKDVLMKALTIGKEGTKTLTMTFVFGPLFFYAIFVTYFALPITKLVSVGINNNLYVSVILFMTLISFQTLLYMGLVMGPMGGIMLCNAAKPYVGGDWTPMTFFSFFNQVAFTTSILSVIFLVSQQYL